MSSNNHYEDIAGSIEFLLKKVLNIFLVLLLCYQVAIVIIPGISLLNYANNLESKMLNHEVTNQIGYIEIAISGIGEVEVFKNGQGRTLKINGTEELIMEVMDGDVLQIKKADNFIEGKANIINVSDNISYDTKVNEVIINKHIKTLCIITINN